MEFQKTIGCDIEFTGIALHSGRKVTVRLIPAEANTGIIFRRVDIKGKPEIPANFNYVVNTLMCTELGNGNIKIKTVEHLLSALFGLGIDNIIIEIDGCEVPAMDGSSYPFVEYILKAGIKELNQLKTVIKIKKEIEIKKGERVVKIVPSERLTYSFYIDYNHPLIGSQFFTYTHSQESYINDISRARTFGFLEEVEKLRKNNLGLGGSLENAIVISNDKILNPEGLRYPDEFVRHKILDAIGDLSLIGMKFIGHYIGIKCGHELNYLLCKSIFEDKEAWEIIYPPPISKKSLNCAIA